ncbi:response regulator transcription factor [Hydrogenophaga sp. 5NK40-0174]|uniref:response regulator transcription factor n=1 Tax=Hydrogenophaga sp. 5NK40-0174 TaxID=3127649 RepID=UPI00310A5123
MNALLIEDDLDLGQALLGSLPRDGIETVWIRTATDARQHAIEHMDLVILDLRLPDGDGLALLQEWRANRQTTPVLIITANAELSDRLLGLNLGADDFLVKPFATPELIARAWAIHRRHQRQANAEWRFGRLSIMPKTREVHLDGRDVALSDREFQILLILAGRPEQIVTKSSLGERLSPFGEPASDATIEVHISNLRRKIGTGLIRTVRGVGYQFRSPA